MSDGLCRLLSSHVPSTGPLTGGSKLLIISVEFWPLLGSGLAPQARPKWPGKWFCCGALIYSMKNRAERLGPMRAVDSCVPVQRGHWVRELPG